MCLLWGQEGCFGQSRHAWWMNEWMSFTEARVSSLWPRLALSCCICLSFSPFSISPFCFSLFSLYFLVSSFRFTCPQALVFKQLSWVQPSLLVLIPATGGVFHGPKKLLKKKNKKTVNSTWSGIGSRDLFPYDAYLLWRLLLDSMCS